VRIEDIARFPFEEYAVKYLSSLKDMEQSVRQIYIKDGRLCQGLLCATAGAAKNGITISKMFFDTLDFIRDMQAKSTKCRKKLY